MSSHAKAELNTQDRDGDTALLRAARQGHEAVVQTLVEAKAELNTQNNYGCTALLEAALYGHSNVVHILQKAMGNERMILARPVLPLPMDLRNVIGEFIHATPQSRKRNRI